MTSREVLTRVDAGAQIIILGQYKETYLAKDNTINGKYPSCLAGHSTLFNGTYEVLFNILIAELSRRGGQKFERIRKLVWMTLI